MAQGHEHLVPARLTARGHRVDRADFVELRHLEHFLAVVDEGSFTAAAQRMHVVQSGVSATIQALERELGAELFTRGRRVTLTDAGRALLPEARATLAAAATARDAVREASGGLRGTVTIGRLHAVDISGLPALLGEFHRRHPRVELRLLTAPNGSPELARALTAGTCDLAFLSVPPGVAPRLSHTVLADLPLVLMTRHDHPLARQTEVEMAQLVSEDFVDFPVGHGSRDVVDRAFTLIGAERSNVFEVSDTSTAAEFIRQGLGIALLPASTSPPSGDADLCVLPVVGEPLRWTISVATSTDRRPSDAVQALLALIGTHCSAPNG